MSTVIICRLALGVGYSALSIAPARSLGLIMNAHKRMPDDEGYR